MDDRKILEIQTGDSDAKQANSSAKVVDSGVNFGAYRPLRRQSDTKWRETVESVHRA